MSTNTRDTEAETVSADDAGVRAAELEVLRTENQRLRAQFQQAKQTRYRRTILAFAAIGLIALAGGLLFPDVRVLLVTLGGTGLFGAILTYFLTPEQFHAATVSERLYESAASNAESVIDELGLQDHRVYVPAGADGSRLYVPSHREFSIPDTDALRSLFVVTDDDRERGAAFRPLGAGLYEDFETAQTSLNDFDKVTSRLQNTVMDMRLIPLRRVVSNLPRVVRDVARSQRKEISFEMHGQDIELDRTILTEISDPLMHILRNAVDHGIEPPAEREAAGKDPEGTIELRASRERDHVTVTVEDDGRGLDVDELRRKALEKGVRSEAELDSMEDSEVYDLVFHPGFSTADEVTDVSGRGVGMDVVHSTVKQLDGSVNVESEYGEGTTVTLRLPVTVAIVKVLFVEVGEEEYGVPIKNIDEVSRLPEIETINEQPMIEHDEEIYPVVDLASELDVPGETANGDGMILRIRKSERRAALRCDDVNKQEEVVVKPLEGVLSGIPGLSGTAVLGDGNIVPILDVVTL